MAAKACKTRLVQINASLTTQHVQICSKSAFVMFMSSTFEYLRKDRILKYFSILQDSLSF